MGFYRYLLVIWPVITILTAVNASVNIALRKATNQSSVYSRFDSSKAVDGCDHTHIGSNCCILTALDQTEAWWQVDLQTQSIIDSVNIIYRDENTLERLAGYEIYLSNTPDWKSGNRCYKDTTADLASMSATQYVACSGFVRYLTIYNDRRFKAKTWYSDYAILELCEVQVFGCPVGEYGNGNCNNDCTNCLGNICNPASGTCAGCITGFSGIWCRCPISCKDASCSTGQCTECYDGYYGPACTPCPSGCSTDPCDKTSGQCVQCDDGLHGRVCRQPCPANCKHNVCTKDNGHCKECDIDFYGDFCNLPCPDNCKNNVCKKDNGQCKECDIGFYGNFCNLSCSVNCKHNVCNKDNGQCAVCIAGFHGSQCLKSCGNCQGVSCDKDMGDCATGCTDGWTGDTCDTKVVIVMNEDAAVGVGVGLGVVILTLVVVIIVLVRNRTMKRGDTTKSTNMTDISTSRTANELSIDQDDNYEDLATHNQEQSIVQISNTEGSYEQLGRREVEIPHIYETINVDRKRRCTL